MTQEHVVINHRFTLNEPGGVIAPSDSNKHKLSRVDIVYDL